MQETSRREFLKAAGGAGLLLGAAPYVLADSFRVHSPNDRIQAAVIGVRSRGRNHIEEFCRRKDVDIVALCDIDMRELEAASKQIVKQGRKAPALVQDIRRLLENREIDVVSIATPNHWHALAAIWAMQAGKDVYVEKPVSHNVLEGRRIVEAAGKTGRICQAGTQIRSNPGAVKAIDFIHHGGIGKVTLARALCYKRRESIGQKPDGPVPAGVDYDLWLGPAPVRAFNPNRFHYNWHWNWDYGNGDLGNQGIHQMDVARWALGKSGLPGAVRSLGGRFGYTDDGETPNTELSFFDYGDAHLIFEVRGLPTEALQGAKVGNIIYGSEGTVVFTSYDEAIVYDKSGAKVKTFRGGGNHFDNFLESVRSRNAKTLHGPIEEGHLSSALCHLGNISYRLGEPQPFQPKTGAFGDDKEAIETIGRFESHLAANGIVLQETTYRLGPQLRIDARHERFANNPKANALLTRSYRAPFKVPDRF